MTLLFSDGFESYTTGGGRTELDPIYDYNAVIDTADANILNEGRVSGKCAINRDGTNTFNRSFGHDIDAASLSSSGTWIVGFAVKYDQNNFSINTNQRMGLIQFRDSAQLPMVSIYISSGVFNVVTGGTLSTTKIGFTDVGILTNVWHYVELKVTFHLTSGAVVMQVDGQSVLSTTGITAPDTGTFPIETVPSYLTVGGTAARTRVLIDDLYVCDSAGSVNNDFLGDIGNRRLDATAEGTTNDFTPNTGTDNSALISETDRDDDTTYVESSTIGHNDLYVMENSPASPGTIAALQVWSTSKTDDGNPKGGSNMVLSGGFESLGGTEAITSAYLPYQSLHPTDPNGGAAWDETGVNAVEVGVEVVS